MLRSMHGAFDLIDCGTLSGLHERSIADIRHKQLIVMQQYLPCYTIQPSTDETDQKQTISIMCEWNGKSKKHRFEKVKFLVHNQKAIAVG